MILFNPSDCSDTGEELTYTVLRPILSTSGAHLQDFLSEDVILHVQINVAQFEIFDLHTFIYRVQKDMSKQRCPYDEYSWRYCFF